MSNHHIALVPLATSQQQTPELFYKGKKADTGLFAESLIYYDTVYVHFDNGEQFASFISIIIQQGLTYEQLIELVEEGTLKFFKTVTIHPVMTRDRITDEIRNDIITQFVAIEEEAIKNPDYFEKTFLDTPFLRDSFSNLSYINKNDFDRFCESAKINSLTFDNQVVSSGLVDNAYEDFLNPERYKLIVKTLLDEIYKINDLGKVADFEVRIRELNTRNMDEIARNLNTTVIGRNFDNDEYKIYEVDCQIPVKGLKDSKTFLNLFRTLPLSVAGVANLYIRSAGKLKCDLFLPNPISQIIGNKLYEIGDLEISKRNIKAQNVIEDLKIEVEFPDLHPLVNRGEIDFVKVLEIRKKGKRFREWLQSEVERDRNAFWAYHNEIAKESGFTKNMRRSLNLFGFVTSTALGGLVGHYLSDNPISSAVGGITTGIVANEVIKQTTRKVSEKLFDYGAGIGKDWKPVCFGKWYNDEISKLLKSKE